MLTLSLVMSFTLVGWQQEPEAASGSKGRNAAQVRDEVHRGRPRLGLSL